MRHRPSSASIATVVTLLLVVAGVGAGASVDAKGPSTAGDALPGSGERPGAATVGDPVENNTTVTILSYNDIQTAAAEDRNLSRLATLIERRRAAHENPTVLVGAGDEVGPHALSPVSQWRAPVAVLNELDPAAEVIGNHEFDYGLDEVENFTAASEFPWLATNLVNASTGESFDGTEPYEIVERNGTRIGIIGLVDREATYGKTNINFSAEGLAVRNFTRVGARTAEMLKNERDVDVVVALAHTGVPQAKRLANATDAVDVIAVGDDEIKYPPRETSGAIITEGVARAQYLSEINLTVSGGEVVAWNGRLLEVTDEIPKNETVSRIIREYRSEAQLDTVVARSEVALNATFGANYHRETNYGNFVTDAMRNATGADVAITNAGGIRSDSVYGPGNITGGDVFNTLPFGNTVVSVNLTGAELKETLASQVVTLESEAGRQYGAEISQQVSGVRFEWVPHNGTRQIRDVYVNAAGPDEPAEWVRLRENETYEVAVNSFMKGGGDGYPLEDAPVVQETDRILAEIVIDYMQAKGTISPAVEGRMQRVDVHVGHADVRLDGNGKLVLKVPAPEDYDGFVPDTFRMSAPGTRSVAAENVRYVPGTNSLLVRFDDAELAALAEGRDSVALDLYGGYESAAYDRTYFEYSVLNADIDAAVTASGNASAAVGPRASALGESRGSPAVPGV
ncbi:bifunctional metallophosphatase/5'-nucleotidase [Halorussus sp. AFM4]|uniref:bifunctional metallophosphatase/5'-nucleotidase n=1 Tax=Halorussus sp. AFM4 TaxID=3421651 RepID=UPI003EBFC1EF